MCSSPSAPRPQPRLPEAPTPPAAGAGGGVARKKRPNSSNTILTSPQGVTDQAATAQKTLLGS